MPLPLITAPAGIPDFLAAGHNFEESELFAAVKPTTGHRRQRRLYTVPERTMNVSWLLSNAQMVVVESWFENDLQAGDRFFSALVQDQDSEARLWWKAKWLAPYRADPLAGGYWRVTGQLQMFETGSASGPVSSALLVDFAVRLTGSAALTVPQPLVMAFSVALTTTNSLGALDFSAALRLPVGDARARAFFNQGEMGAGALGRPIALALAFME